MKKWTVVALYLFYMFSVANCQNNKIGKSCRTQSGKPGNFQSRLRCPSLRSNSEGSKNAAIICCPHQTFTRIVTTRKKTSTRRSGRKDRASTPAPDPYSSVCGKGAPPRSKRKARSIYDEETSDEYYESGENITDPDIKFPHQFNMTTAMVVGGSQATPHSRPWMAALVDRPFYSSQMKIFCGATLITDLYVLSAAHCVVRGGRVRRDFSVRLGGHSLNDGSTHSVQYSRVHPRYRNFYNDISLIRLKERLAFTTHISPICLPTPAIASSSMEKQPAMVSGWGTTSVGGPQSKVLKEAQVSVVPRRQCDRSYSYIYGSSGVITSNQICANSRGTDTCQGDSGGPLSYYGSDRKWYEIGVTSFGQGCAQLRYPGVYTRVGAYVNWIRANIKA